jgi:hypothetical protein
MPSLVLDDDARRTASGRLKMFLVLAVCAAPVIASYLTYFVIRPQARTNYSELIIPTVAVPADLPLATLAGQPVSSSSLHKQWLMIVVADADCDAACEKRLYIQRQLHEALGAEKGRVDKVWFVTDDKTPRPELMQAITQGQPPTVLRVSRNALARWLTPASDHRIDEHIYVVDPMGQWMMRAPVEPDPSKLKRDLDRLLRASVGWDTPGR